MHPRPDVLRERVRVGLYAVVHGFPGPRLHIAVHQCVQPELSALGADAKRPANALRPGALADLPGCLRERLRLDLRRHQ